MTCTKDDRGGCKGHLITTLGHIVLYSAAEAFGWREDRLFTWSWPAHGDGWWARMCRFETLEQAISSRVFFYTLTSSIVHIVDRSLILSMGQC